MLNIIWPVFIIISFGYAIVVGNLENVNKSIFDSAESAVELSIAFLGTMCLWNGLMKIVQETTLIDKLTKLLNPAMRFLFPELKKTSKANKEMSMNIIANILGLGNAATPLGIRAMNELQKKNDPKKYIIKYYDYVHSIKYSIITINTYNCYCNKNIFRIRKT